MIRTFRHQWVYTEADRAVNPVFPNLREIYLPALGCSAEQLANLLKILVAERGTETIVIDENPLDFQRIRYSRFFSFVRQLCEYVRSSYL